MAPTCPPDNVTPSRTGLGFALTIGSAKDVKYSSTGLTNLQESRTLDASSEPLQRADLVDTPHVPGQPIPDVIDGVNVRSLHANNEFVAFQLRASNYDHGRDLVLRVKLTSPNGNTILSDEWRVPANSTPPSWVWVWAGWWLGYTPGEIIEAGCHKLLAEATDGVSLLADQTAYFMVTKPGPPSPANPAPRIYGLHLTSSGVVSTLIREGVATGEPLNVDPRGGTSAQVLLKNATTTPKTIVLQRSPVLASSTFENIHTIPLPAGGLGPWVHLPYGGADDEFDLIFLGDDGLPHTLYHVPKGTKLKPGEAGNEDPRVAHGGILGSILDTLRQVAAAPLLLDPRNPNNPLYDLGRLLQDVDWPELVLELAALPAAAIRELATLIPELISLLKSLPLNALVIIAHDIPRLLAFLLTIPTQAAEAAADFGGRANALRIMIRGG